MAEARGRLVAALEAGAGVLVFVVCIAGGLDGKRLAPRLPRKQAIKARGGGYRRWPAGFRGGSANVKPRGR